MTDRERQIMSKHTPGPEPCGCWIDRHQHRIVRCPTCAAAPALLEAAEALHLLDLDCEADPLNPCWRNRPTDEIGRHWGGGEACAPCYVRAAIAAAKGE